MTREEAITMMKKDVSEDTEWGDMEDVEFHGTKYTPNFLIQQAEEGTELGLAFVDQIYIPNAELLKMLGLHGIDIDLLSKDDSKTSQKN